MEDAQVVLRCAFVRKKQYQANLKGFLFVSHFRFQADHIGMTLAKAEALFHLTEFEQALLHFHNGLVRFCQSLCSSSPLGLSSPKFSESLSRNVETSLLQTWNETWCLRNYLRLHRSWTQETRRSTWESEDVGALCVNFFQTMSSRLLVNVNRSITASNNTINVLQSMTMEEVSVISKGR